MASWDDVGRIARGLPEVAEDDLEALGARALSARAPAGPMLCAYVPDVGIMDALIADDPVSFFTTPHFRGFPAVEAWLCRAPKLLAKNWLEKRHSM
ncbi:MAG TPA: MmcQ/YjbR family DNA-binding protein [Amycolatopsis sp.]|uniref:MmcQ/YjbR family DNA-binding protein n=1 Tax=Amycolatopsis nalaikhensis TaxID=715472 RepID=A0ABY8XPS0_9PSEU|nr:MmcQ/YjbR family DNA-binding protein [Amycolatopsis sp. 2-2]WIV57628.1 MmcQ/YjbR family DNA-binding protein [Amycolatopsis sp. 2-2]